MLWLWHLSWCLCKSLLQLLYFQKKFVDELDSYMYQTVGHQGIELYAEAMGLPLYREMISGVAVDQGRNYQPTENDEVEDLYRLLARIKVNSMSQYSKLFLSFAWYLFAMQIPCLRILFIIYYSFNMNILSFSCNKTCFTIIII